MYKGFNFRTSMVAVAASALFGSVLLTASVSPAVALPSFHPSAHAIA